MLNLSQAKKRIMISFNWLSVVMIFIALAIAPANTISQPLPGELAAVAWSPNGDMIAGAGLDGLLRIWDETGVVLQDFPGITRAVTTVAWSPDGTRIASGGGDNTIRIWDIEGPLLASIDGHTANIMSVAWSPDGSFLASASHTGADPYSLRIWDGNTYQPLFQQDSGRINSIAWNPDPMQSELAIANENGYVSIRPVTSTEIQISRLAYAGNSPMLSVAWNSDGSRLASGDETGKIDIWDTTNFNNIQTLIEHTDFIGALTWGPEDTQLASASNDGTIRIWDIATGQTVSIFQNPKQSFTTSIDWNTTGLIFGRADASVEIIQFPTANAGTDQTVTDSDGSGSELVTLDGSASTDTDGTIVSYSWTENGIEIATGVSPQVDLAVGTHTITLTVTDNDGATDTDDVVITVEAPSTACNTTIPAADTTSLISAITSANGAGTPQTLCLSNSIYTLNAVDNTTDGSNGLPSITGDITIVGDGATIIFADGGGFEVAEGGTLTLEQVTVIGGDEPGSHRPSARRDRCRRE